MWDDSCSLVLTPQAFSNINPKADIFNNINQQFWEYVLPGCDALGYIACTGTNFCLRARSLAQVRQPTVPAYSRLRSVFLSLVKHTGHGLQHSLCAPHSWTPGLHQCVADKQGVSCCPSTLCPPHPLTTRSAGSQSTQSPRIMPCPWS